MAKKKGKTYLSWLFILILGFGGFYLYQRFIAGAVKLKDKNYTYIYIERNDSFEDVLSDINSENIIEDPKAFEWLAKKMKLDENIHAGKFRINNGMTMRQIINLIRYNKQEKVKLSFNSQIRTMEEFVEYTADKLELSESDIEDIITDEQKLDTLFGLNPDNCFGAIVPGVFEVSWAVSPEEFFNNMSEVYHSVWNKSRKNKAKQLGYTVPQVISLASIVQSESIIESEQEKIAGVYINRLNKDMPLQADPTLKFANGNFEVRRVLDVDKEIDSPYNTYRYKGLPPGPICLVSTQAIDATLNYTRHNYIFFCAKPQLNGYSDFSATYEQHQKYRNQYRKALDKRGINR
ncbi:MAG: endolytic transglycosylase MltG [Bacteroidia bacterium]|nr:endolytic transglycosylase MltG [Bacteroidia bacterium]